MTASTVASDTGSTISALVLPMSGDALRADEEHRCAGSADDILGDAAQKRGSETAVPMRRHAQHRPWRSGEGFEDRIRRGSVGDHADVDVDDGTETIGAIGEITRIPAAIVGTADQQDSAVARPGREGGCGPQRGFGEDRPVEGHDHRGRGTGELTF